MVASNGHHPLSTLPAACTDDKVEEPEKADPFEALIVQQRSVDSCFFTHRREHAVGQTVCWSGLTSMPHNVKQVDGFKSTTYVEAVTTQALQPAVAFSYTFTEDTTFYYACQPHIAMDMFGEIVVGDGGSEPAAEPADESEDTPGFMAAGALVAVIGALALMGRTRDEN